MPNPSTIAMQDEEIRTLLELTQGEVEALERRLRHIRIVLDNPEGLHPVDHARYASEARALRKVLNYGD